MNEGSVVSALLQSGLLLEGGISTTLNNNTQQSDKQTKDPGLVRTLRCCALHFITQMAHSMFASLSLFFCVRVSGGISRTRGRRCSG